MKKQRIAVFASGTGSNARRMMEHFQGHKIGEVALVVSNRAQAGVLKTAESFGVETLLLQRSSFYESEQLVTDLNDKLIDFIVLAGFLWLIPSYLVRAFPNKIVNIHPSLLPKFGGKGMYGHHVHEAVRASGDIQTGISIHFVNEAYDEGQLLFQATCPVFPEDKPSDIATRVLCLEHEFFPEIVERQLKKNVTT